MLAWPCSLLCGLRRLACAACCQRLERVISSEHALYVRFFPDNAICDEYEKAAKEERKQRRSMGMEEARARFATAKAATSSTTGSGPGASPGPGTGSGNSGGGDAGPADGKPPKACRLCSRNFGPFRRRFRCASCEGWACGECARALRVTQRGNERVCDECMLDPKQGEATGAPDPEAQPPK